MKKILFISFDHIGDIVRFSAFLRNLRYFYPQAFISVLLTPVTAPLLANSPFVDEVISFDFKDIKQEKKSLFDVAYNYTYEFLRQLRNVRYDLIINPYSDIGAVIAGYLKPKMLLGRVMLKWGEYKLFGEEAAKFFCSMKEICKLRVYNDMRFIDSSLKLLLDLGIKEKDIKYKKPYIHISRKDKEFAADFAGEYKNNILLGVHPFSSDIRRMYPLKKLCNILNLLVNEHEVKIIFFGSKAETARFNNDILPYLSFQPIIAIGKTTLLQSAALINLLDLFLCVDSGLMHIANIFDVYIIGLFARNASIIREALPIGNSFTIIEENEISLIKEDTVLKTLRNKVNNLLNKED